MNFIHQLLSYPQVVLSWINIHIFTLKLISNFISVIFLIGIAYCIWRSQYLIFQVDRWIDVLNIKTLSKRRAKRGWRQVQRRLKHGGTTNFKLAILEADRIFDEILKLSGFNGETMDDRLKNVTEDQISKIEQLKQAHRISVKIARDPEYVVDLKHAKETTDVYKELFREFGLVD